MRKSLCSLICFLALLQFLSRGAVAGDGEDFQTCLKALRARAVARGFGNTTIQAAFANVHPMTRVLELDRRQPEFNQTFWQYLDARVTPARYLKGRRLLGVQQRLLDRIHHDFGVQPSYILSFWGLETNFGATVGSFPVVNALATLACDPRRSTFFTGQLMDALKIVDEGSIDVADMKGSWAGAMGQTQFMPSAFTRYAVDYDGDGKRDLWHSLPDALASAANYLHTLGWHDHERWGREVRLPRRFEWKLAGLETVKSVTEWRSLGVRKADGSRLPRSNLPASLLLPQGHRGPAFLVYPNFRVIMQWNTAVSYALAVGRLADRIAGLGGLHSAPPANDRPLSADEIRRIQRRLDALGFDAGTADGILGSRTRQAIRAFQQQAGLAADGYPDARFRHRLERAAINPKPKAAGADRQSAPSG